MACATTHRNPTLQQLGEFAVIDRLVRGRRQPAAVAVGPGDDAAVVQAKDGRIVVSTDMLVQDRHFRLDWSTPHDVGRKAIAQNAADIEAMGARPTAFVVGSARPVTRRRPTWMRWSAECGTRRSASARASPAAISSAARSGWFP